MRKLTLPIALTLVTTSLPAAAEPFTYMPVGDLIPGSGEGRVDEKVYAPGMRFPMENGPAFANSQVWGVGGSQGPAGSQCSAQNYGYPWRDNYCETRSWDMPLCPAGTGHQGQDIRPGTCELDVHKGVAVVDGTITSIGGYSVYLTAADGTRFDYLHMSNVQVVVGQKVKRGDMLGLVSNQFNGTPTTTHLHFNISQNVAGIGTVYVPPYTSLIQAYQALIGPVNMPGKGALESVSCEGLRGFAQDPDAPDAAVQIRLSFDGATGEMGVKEGEVTASRYRDDLCASLGSCEHGFSTNIPAGLMDGLPHEVHAYAVDPAGGVASELDGSPMVFTCALPLPSGVRRHVADTTFAAWSFDELWDVALVDDSFIEALPIGSDLPKAPELAKSDGNAAEAYLLDGQTKRLVKDKDTEEAWSFDLANAPVTPASELDSRAIGPEVRPRPLVLKGSGADLWLVDDPLDAKSQSQEAAAADATDAAGCSCQVDSAGRFSHFWAPLGLLALALGRRRASRQG